MLRLSGYIRNIVTSEIKETKKKKIVDKQSKPEKNQNLPGDPQRSAVGF